MKHLLCCLLLLTWINFVDAQSSSPINSRRTDRLEAWARKSEPSDERTIESLSAYLKRGARTETELARLAFSWLAFHIRYDATAFNSGRYPDQSASGVLKSRKAVCDGFANLFAALCNQAGLEAHHIGGYAKGFGYQPGKRFSEPDHAWNAVMADGRWILVDPTWGEGYGEGHNGRMVARKQFNDYWFDVDPQEFIFSHFPEDPRWQLLAEPLTKQAFEELPWVDPMMHFYGFPREVIYETINRDPKAVFVTLYMVDQPLTILEAPALSSLMPGEEVTIRIRSASAVDIAMINNDRWLKFRQEGDLFVSSLSPEAGSLFIGVRFAEKEKEYQMVLEYRVGK